MLMQQETNLQNLLPRLIKLVVLVTGLVYKQVNSVKTVKLKLKK